MRRTTNGSVFATALLALLLGACASSDVGDIFGGSDGRVVSEVKGTVRSVDIRSGDCVIELDNATTSNYRLQNDRYGTNSGSRQVVYCDNETRVVFQGQSYRPENLERGDEIVADVSEVNGRLVADRIDVTYDVSGNDRSNDRYRDDRYGNDPYARDEDRNYEDDRYSSTHDLRGTVRRVDPQSRTLTLDRVDYYSRSFDRNYDRNGTLTLYYDTQTRVLFRGESFRPENLEPGDVVAVEVDDVRGTLVADQIDVVSDARGRSAQYPR